MHKETEARNGARKVIDTCLGLTEGQELLVLFDETTTGVAHLLLEEAQQIGVHAAAIYVPVSIQAQLDEGTELPLITVSAIREAVGIVTCVTDNPACLPFRAKIFDIGLDNRSRIGHMPGVTIDILPMADADYQQVSADCELLASALLKGRRLELITHDSSGREYQLSADIGGWTRSPAISDGLIKRGGWANIPPGEAFIAPLEGTAQGTVVVDGSLPGYVIPPGGEVWLEFRDGELAGFRSDDARCLEILRGMEDFARERKDPYWRNLAEIGLGVNPAVEPLTGIELLDEKKYGTAHVALGENDWFGGAVSSTIHNDLIILGPTVRIDGQTVVAGGRIQTTCADWREDHRQLAIDPDWCSSFSVLSRSGTRGDRGMGLLSREWVSGRGNPRSIQVGADASARKAAYLYGQIPPVGGQIRVETLLAHNADLDAEEVYQLIHLMQMYELLSLT
jgi:hypothetical protein